MSKLVIPHDKANHALYGALIFSVTFAAVIFFVEPITAILTALGLVVVIAAGKEIRDRHINWRSEQRGQAGTQGVEAMDAIATILGGLIAAIPIGLLLYLE